MKIVATADLHGNLPEIPECDLLLIGGDVCPVWDHDRKFQARWLRHDFHVWLKQVPAKEIVAVGGNHDFVLNDSLKFKRELPWHLLYGESVEINGLKIWGSPMSPTFGNWAFMRDDRGLAEEWEKIPTDVDILMVHGPMFGYGDNVKYGFRRAGSQTLRNRLDYLDFPNLKLFVCGHIHEDYGTWITEGGFNKFKVVNASLVNFDYEAVNPPMVFDL